LPVRSKGNHMGSYLRCPFSGQRTSREHSKHKRTDQTAPSNQDRVQTKCLTSMTWGMKNMHVCGRSSEASSHPIDKTPNSKGVMWATQPHSPQPIDRTLLGSRDRITFRSRQLEAAATREMVLIRYGTVPASRSVLPTFPPRCKKLAPVVLTSTGSVSSQETEGSFKSESCVL
jgi:2-succinyl-5-enolpyruvyl-6-hydroxy-3-cyclohexene-1-carboxylate synthase